MSDKGLAGPGNSEPTGDTIRILRPPPRVYTNPLGQNLWMGEVEPVELELDREHGTNTDPYNSAPLIP